VPLFYFGLSSTTAYAIALLLAVVSLYLFFKQLHNQTVTATHGKLLCTSAVVVVALLYVANDLKSPVTSHQASNLEKFYQTSIEYTTLGADFRNAMSDLAEKNGAVVTAQQSYKGTDYYTDYVKKEDWNSLAKVYNESNLPK